MPRITKSERRIYRVCWKQVYVTRDDLGRDIYAYSYKLNGKQIGRVRAANVIAKHCEG